MCSRVKGQASVALIATVPALIGLALVLAQLALVGHAALSAANAARAAARAAHVGGDPSALGRGALPALLRRGSEIEVDGGRVTVRVRVPRLLPFLPRLPVEAGTSLGEPAAAVGGQPAFAHSTTACGGQPYNCPRSVPTPPSVVSRRFAGRSASEPASVGVAADAACAGGTGKDAAAAMGGGTPRSCLRTFGSRH